MTTQQTHSPAAGPTLVQGVLADRRDGMIVLDIPGTDYQLHLLESTPTQTTIGKKIRGRITAQARRVDVIKTGGRYIEPVAGRPRRIQGRIVAIDHDADAVVVNAAVPIHCKTNAHQRATDFAVDQLGSFDALPGARFEPVDEPR